MSSVKLMKIKAEAMGLHIAGYNPGDGTRHRVYSRECWPDDTDPDYFDTGYLYCCMKRAELAAWLDGYAAAYYRERPKVNIEGGAP